MPKSSWPDSGLAEQASRSPRYFYRVLARLRSRYEFDNLGNLQDPLDELIYIVLSTRTRGDVFLRTFLSLKSRYPEWPDILADEPGALESILRPSGLSAKKAGWLRALLKEIDHREGQIDLSRLTSMDDEEAEDYLTSLPGIGVKTARCVLMYSLHRKTFPVDANVRRILERTGVIPKDVHYSKIHDLAQDLIPRELGPELHIYSVIHGRATCTPRNPRCISCPILVYCDHGRREITRLTNTG